MKVHLRGIRTQINHLIKHFGTQKYYLKLNNISHFDEDVVYLKSTIEELKLRKIKVREQMILNIDSLQKFQIRLQLQQGAIMSELEHIIARKRRSG